jgi:two-component system OmpR family sensor kinase
MNGRSLRTRVTVATALVLALGLALLTAAAMLVLGSQLDSDISSALSERADAQLATLGRRDGRTVVRPVADEAPLDERSWVFDERGRMLRRAAAPPDVERAARALARVSAATRVDVGEDVRLLAEPAYGQGGSRRIGTVVVGASLRPYDRTEHLALLAMLALDAFIVAFGALLARRAVGKALQPVADMTAQAEDWSEHDLHRRFDMGAPTDELTALSATLDHLLARIESSLRHEQRFSAEMAHELRTPLSGVRAEAELALRKADLSPDVRDSLQQVVAGTERMQAVIETLMVAARGAGDSAGVSDARDGARSALAASAPAAEGRAVRLTLADDSSEPRRVGAGEDLVSAALQPLIDNAIRHARTRVTVRVERGDGMVLVHVEDDGAGIGDLEAIFAPGASDSGGAGLGLPLARRLARSAGGDVTALRADGGHVVLRLPAVA